MKNFCHLTVTAIYLLLGIIPASAQERNATVKGDRVNVRGQAALDSEVITQLKSGETVIVIEEITNEKPAPGEPARWSKILLPSNTPVWVSALFIDADTKTVNASRLNVRAGPGEQFSVVARLQKGDKVREIRTVDDWMEIETPQGTHAFVASDLLNLPEAPLTEPTAKIAGEPTPKPPERAKPMSAPPVTAPVPITIVETVVEEAPPVVAADIKTRVVEVESPAKPKLTVEPIVSPPPIVAVPPVATPDPVISRPNVAAPAPEPVIAPAPPVPNDSNDPPPRRIVEREGIVKRVWSIQSPTAYGLYNESTDQLINYLYTSDTGLQLKYYSGLRIRVTGQESLDSRWTKTPLISIQTLQTLP